MTIINPYSNTNLPQQKGGIHCHSTNSDGSLSPTDLVTTYNNSGYAFVSITDHDFITNKQNIPGINHIVGSEVSHIDLNANDGLGHIEGFHYNIIGIGDAVTFTNLISGRLQDNIINIKMDGSFVIMNHSSYLLHDSTSTTNGSISNAEFDKFIGHYHAVEVYNRITYTGSDALTYSSSENSLYQYDRLLGLGHRLFCTASDDTHAIGNIGRGWLQVFSEDNSTENILAALHSGNYYSVSTSVNNSSVVINKVSLVDTSLTVISNAPAIFRYYGVKNDIFGSLLHTEVVSVPPYSSTYNITGTEIYVRAQITDLVDSTKIAYLNPLFVPYWPIQVSLNYTGFNLLPSITFTSTKTSIFQPYFTLIGTCNTHTNYLIITLNDSTKFNAVFPLNNAWEYTFNNLPLGDNVFHVTAYNSLTKKSVLFHYELTYTLLVADDVIYVTPFVMTDAGIRRLIPIVEKNNRLIGIKVKIGTQSTSINLLGVFATGSIGTFTITTPSNGCQLIGVQGVGAIGYIEPTSHGECLIEGVFGTGDYGTLICEEVPTIDLIGVFGTGSWGDITLEVYTPSNYTLNAELQVFPYINIGAYQQCESGAYTTIHPVTKVRFAFTNPYNKQVWIKDAVTNTILATIFNPYNGTELSILNSSSLSIKLVVYIYNPSPSTFRIDQVTY